MKLLRSDWQLLREAIDQVNTKRINEMLERIENKAAEQEIIKGYREKVQVIARTHGGKSEKITCHRINEYLAFGKMIGPTRTLCIYHLPSQLHIGLSGSKKVVLKAIPEVLKLDIDWETKGSAINASPEAKQRLRDLAFKVNNNQL